MDFSQILTVVLILATLIFGTQFRGLYAWFRDWRAKRKPKQSLKAAAPPRTIPAKRVSPYFDAVITELRTSLAPALSLIQPRGRLNRRSAGAEAVAPSVPESAQPVRWHSFKSTITRWEVQRVPLGRPNPKEDGMPLPLMEATTVSTFPGAYTRCEPDEWHPEPRIITVTCVPGGQWQVFEWRLHQNGGQGSFGMNGWPMKNLDEAEAYTAFKLDVPRANVWWPAHGPLSIEYAPDHFGFPQPLQFLGPRSEKPA